MSSIQKVNIFCPVETINRELDFRLFFAALAVRPDLRFVVGHRYTIYDLAMEIGGGVYVGQSMRPVAPSANKDSLMKRLEAMRARGTTLIVLDEEGGVMTGDEARWKQWLDFRVDATALLPHEHLCTWGNWQRDYYRELNPKSAHHIHTTGHPRFDLYKPQFRSYYDEETVQWKERYGDFVLINTNFAVSNNIGGDKVPFPSHWHATLSAAQKIDGVRYWSHVGQVRAKMVALVMRLSIEMPHLNFVIRPHPSEDMQSYRTIFGDARNVFVEHEGSVGSWLLSCRALIHDGCTTALEAHFCDVPIINYKGVIDQRYDLMLPNALGERCESEDRVLDCLQKIISGDTNVGKTAALPTQAKDLIHNFEHDAFAALTDYVHGVSKNAKAATDERVLQNTWRQGAQTSISSSKWKMRWLQRAHKTARGDKVQSDKKPGGFEEADLPRKFEAVQCTLDKDVRFAMLSNRAFVVEC